MPKSKKQASKIDLFPPKVSISKRTDKYNLYLDVQWGEYRDEIKLTKEFASLTERAIEAISASLLKASETTKPYITYGD
jgi:hypothetical protein